jgi:WD40 repeat protein
MQLVDSHGELVNSLLWSNAETGRSCDWERLGFHNLNIWPPWLRTSTALTLMDCTVDREPLQVYHAKRMQRVFCVRFSGDSSYVFSGSDDMNVRVWKAEASEQLGVTLPREKHKQVRHFGLLIAAK